MDNGIIDFHTHAFPDALAPRAMRVLLNEAPEVKAYLDGTLGNLLRSMDRTGIAVSVVCGIATKPSQFEPILRWCDEIRSERIVPFPSVHPADPECTARVRQIAREGFKGLKLHPFYQNFFVNEDRMRGLYETAAQEGLPIVMHTGYDIAFPRIRRADPQGVLRLTETYPDLTLITTHFGAWQQWDEVEQYLLGRPIYMDISFALDDLGRDRARQMILRHPAEFVLFGTDSPWTDQAATLALIERLDLPNDRHKAILSGNAGRLLRFDGRAGR
jgi:hypothetical protein